MEDFAPLDMSPRSRKSAVQWAKEKLKAADYVAVGVNVVVGALLVGGLVGAVFLPGKSASDPDLNAAIGSHEGTADNATQPSPAAGSIPEGDGHYGDDEREREKEK